MVRIVWFRRGGGQQDRRGSVLACSEPFAVWEKFNKKSSSFRNWQYESEIFQVASTFMVVMRAVTTVYESRNTPGHFPFGPVGLPLTEIWPLWFRYIPSLSSIFARLRFWDHHPTYFGTGKCPFLLSVPAITEYFQMKIKDFENFQNFIEKYQLLGG